MSKHLALTGKAIISALKGAGFVIVRARGSHVFLQHDDGRATVIAGETYCRGGGKGKYNLGKHEAALSLLF